MRDFQHGRLGFKIEEDLIFEIFLSKFFKCQLRCSIALQVHSKNIEAKMI